MRFSDRCELSMAEISRFLNACGWIAGPCARDTHVLTWCRLGCARDIRLIDPGQPPLPLADDLRH
jgi:hypothetical protein